MMADERTTILIDAIKHQGEHLAKRAQWYQNMIDRSSQSILNCQETIKCCQMSLEATNVALDSLRAEYRKLLQGNGASP